MFRERTLEPNTSTAQYKPAARCCSPHANRRTAQPLCSQRDVDNDDRQPQRRSYACVVGKLVGQRTTRAACEPITSSQHTLSLSIRITQTNSPNTADHAASTHLCLDSAASIFNMPRRRCCCCNCNINQSPPSATHRHNQPARPCLRHAFRQLSSCKRAASKHRYIQTIDPTAVRGRCGRNDAQRHARRPNTCVCASADKCRDKRHLDDGDNSQARTCHKQRHEHHVHTHLLTHWTCTRTHVALSFVRAQPSCNTTHRTRESLTTGLIVRRLSCCPSKPQPIAVIQCMCQCNVRACEHAQ